MNGNLYNFNDRLPELKRELKAAGAYHHEKSLANVDLRATLFYNTVIQRLEAQQKYEQLVVVTRCFYQNVKRFSIKLDG